MIEQSIHLSGTKVREMLLSTQITLPEFLCTEVADLARAMQVVVYASKKFGTNSIKSCFTLQTQDI
ncbi:MAG: hypothetical protein PUP93_17580 [Rhizonema sp. NSF051]|nr:hypothetical protein [Rhizonema sp. NSF051]